MLKLFYDVNSVDPVVKSETYWAHDHSEKIEYQSFFNEKKSLIQQSSIEDCDFVFIPYKFKNEDLTKNKIYQKSLEHEKTVIQFFNDDNDRVFALPQKNFYLFRTSTYKKQILSNEIIMPAFCETFDYVPPNAESITKQKISFCGNPYEPARINFFKKILSFQSLNKNFVFRQGFWAPEIQNKEIARKQFVDNLREGLFGICIRGNGNFSYRLYETLALGRIPIIINSDLKLPLEKHIDWKNVAITIEESQLIDLEIIINDFIKNHDVELICQQNKFLYDEYFSPLGLIKHFHLYIEECNH